MWFLLALAPFVLGTVWAGGTVLEGVILFIGVSMAIILFKLIFGAIMLAREEKQLSSLRKVNWR